MLEMQEASKPSSAGHWYVGAGRPGENAPESGTISNGERKEVGRVSAGSIALGLGMNW